MSHHNPIFGPQQTIFPQQNLLEIPFTLSSSFEDEYGVDAIITDFPLELKDLCEKNNLKWF